MILADRVAAIPFRRIVWLLPVVFSLHELEEWNIMTWYRAEFANPPDTPDVAVRTLLVTFSLLGFLWTAVGCSLGTRRTTAYVVLPFFVPFVLANNLQHIYWQVAFRAYAPGVLTSAFLNIPAVLLVSWHAWRNRLVAGRYVTGLYLLSLLPLVSAVRAGRVMSPAMVGIHELGRSLAETLLGAV